MDLNQFGFGSMLKSQLVMIFLHLLSRKTFVNGQIKTISVPEGIYFYPKILQTISFSSNESIACFVDSARFAPPNGLRSPHKPQLFGVKSFEKSNFKRRRRSVTDGTSLAQQSHITVVGNQTATMSTIPFTQKSTSTELSSVFVTERLGTTFSPFPATTAKISTTQMMTDSTTSMPATTQNQTSSSTGTATSAAPSPGQKKYHLVQLYDLDREKEDKHLVTVHCFEKNKLKPANDFGDVFLIKVEDINDNSPIFEQSSLESSVSKNITTGDAALLLKATDADLGINALLRFGMVLGTERLRYKNEAKEVHSHSASFDVLPSGYVIMTQKYEREVTITFKVTVKDRGDFADGNRATATATINIYETLPPSPSKSSQVLWWWIALPCAIALFLVVLAIVLIFKRFTRKRRHRRDLLVIDDGSFLNNDDNTDIPVGRFRHSRTDSDHALQSSDDDALVT